MRDAEFRAMLQASRQRNRYDKDLIIDAITKGQSQSYISEKYGLSRSQYYKIKASV